MDTFYIYEQVLIGPHRAVIHHGSCGECNKGYGRPRAFKPTYGKWHGPFASLALAEFAAAALYGVMVRGKHRCVEHRTTSLTKQTERRR